MREFATVEEIANDYVALRTTRDELYHIDTAYATGLEVGGLSLVIYDPKDKKPVGDYYELTPTFVEPADNRVVLDEKHALPKE